MKAVGGGWLTCFRWSTLIIALGALAAHTFCTVAQLQQNAGADLRFAKRSIADPTVYVFAAGDSEPLRWNPWSVLALTQATSSLSVALHLIGLNLGRVRNR